MYNGEYNYVGVRVVWTKCNSGHLTVIMLVKARLNNKHLFELMKYFRWLIYSFVIIDKKLVIPFQILLASFI